MLHLSGGKDGKSQSNEHNKDLTKNPGTSDIITEKHVEKFNLSLTPSSLHRENQPPNNDINISNTISVKNSSDINKSMPLTSCSTVAINGPSQNIIQPKSNTLETTTTEIFNSKIRVAEVAKAPEGSRRTRLKQVPRKSCLKEQHFFHKCMTLRKKNEVKDDVRKGNLKVVSCADEGKICLDKSTIHDNQKLTVTLSGNNEISQFLSSESFVSASILSSLPLSVSSNSLLASSTSCKVTYTSSIISDAITSATTLNVTDSTTVHGQVDNHSANRIIGDRITDAPSITTNLSALAIASTTGLNVTGNTTDPVQEVNCPVDRINSAPSTTTNSSAFTINENSLTVFSLMEKQVAEMTGEEFIPRHMRNQHNSGNMALSSTAIVAATSNLMPPSVPSTYVKSSSTFQSQSLTSTSVTSVHLLPSSSIMASSIHTHTTNIQNHLERNSSTPCLPNRSHQTEENPAVLVQDNSNDDDSSFYRELSTPNAVHVRPISPSPSVLERNLDLVDHCLKNCLGGLLHGQTQPSTMTTTSEERVDAHGTSHDDLSNGNVDDQQSVTLNAKDPQNNNIHPPNLGSGEEEEKENIHKENSNLQVRQQNEMESVIYKNELAQHSTNSSNCHLFKRKTKLSLSEGVEAVECSSLPALLPSMKQSSELLDSDVRPSTVTDSLTSPSRFKPLLHANLKVHKPMPFMSPPLSFERMDKRTVISVDSLHSPYIPAHCKKMPTRRVTPVEVSYWTPSPLQVPSSPSSPARFVIDIPPSPAASTGVSPCRTSISIVQSTPITISTQTQPLGRPAGLLNPSSINSPPTDGFRKFKSGADPVLPRLRSYQDESSSKSDFMQNGMELDMPLSPSKRKPRRIVPKRLTTFTSKCKFNFI